MVQVLAGRARLLLKAMYATFVRAMAQQDSSNVGSRDDDTDLSAAA
jgi:hypothetical protein